MFGATWLSIILFNSALQLPLRPDVRQTTLRRSALNADAAGFLLKEASPLANGHILSARSFSILA
jgi:hypothetical protein